MKFILWIAFSLSPILAFAAEPSEDSCDFYLKVERQTHCSQLGSKYLTGFGYRYCQRFLQKRESWDDFLQGWARGTAFCLQNKLNDYLQDFSSCEEMEEVAFASHASCYAENGFCELFPWERWKIYHTIRALDVAKHFHESLEAYIDLLRECRGS